MGKYMNVLHVSVMKNWRTHQSFFFNSLLHSFLSSFCKLKKKVSSLWNSFPCDLCRSHLRVILKLVVELRFGIYPSQMPRAQSCLLACISRGVKAEVLAMTFELLRDLLHLRLPLIWSFCSKHMSPPLFLNTPSRLCPRLWTCFSLYSDLFSPRGTCGFFPCFFLSLLKPPLSYECFLNLRVHNTNTPHRLETPQDSTFPFVIYFFP